jgi:hypothetical protein
MKRKLIQFKVPAEMYEEFYRAFPARGERSNVLRKLVVLATDMAKHKDAFYEMIREEANLEADIWSG